MKASSIPQNLIAGKDKVDGKPEAKKVTTETSAVEMKEDYKPYSADMSLDEKIKNLEFNQTLLMKHRRSLAAGVDLGSDDNVVTAVASRIFLINEKLTVVKTELMALYDEKDKLNPRTPSTSTTINQ